MTTRDEAASDGMELINSDPSLTQEQREAEIRRMRENLGYDDDYGEEQEMSFEDFKRYSCRYADAHRRHQRTGQALFNALENVRPDLANRIRGDVKLDPFYKYGVDILPCIDFIRHNWETTP